MGNYLKLEEIQEAHRVRRDRLVSSFIEFTRGRQRVEIEKFLKIKPYNSFTKVIDGSLFTDSFTDSEAIDILINEDIERLIVENFSEFNHYCHRCYSFSPFGRVCCDFIPIESRMRQLPGHAFSRQ